MGAMERYMGTAVTVIVTVSMAVLLCAVMWGVLWSAFQGHGDGLFTVFSLSAFGGGFLLLTIASVVFGERFVSDGPQG